ncbi:TPA: hydantoinase/oxoprolinase family protein [Candidatus Bipolaricaulota bacterium]|nr:hydantoinase/oxoprolinase family protein [Candidatus Bipolaricaulota bacterium]
MAKRVAIDIGGTFTDFVSLDEDTGEILLEKALTTPHNFAEGVINTIARSGTDPREYRQFVHGTTVVINSLTERKGAKVALITTRGFRDVLEIQRANRPDMYNLFYQKPKPFVARRYRFEVRERVNFRGEVLQPLVEEDVVAAVEACKAAGIEAIAVCYIHAYANPTHERRTREIIEELLPGVPVTLSHEITQEWREYERTNTTVLNAYVQPVATLYLSTLDRELSVKGLSGVKYAMQSNGGTTTFPQAQRVPIHLVESGPVGGVIGAGVIARAVGEDSVIAFDMGGTTAKVSLIDRGQLKIDTDYHIGKTSTWAGYPLKIPVVDIVEVGAGGGSIAWIDQGGALHVGPKSAGADPGPACYGLGGTEPTVTDANLLTGRLNPDYFLGGQMRLNIAKAEAAIRKIAEPFSLSVIDAAMGILRLANANMRAALERVSIERGHDPRDFTLVAYGGAGGLHGATLARELRMKKVIVPRAPGQFSAWGMLMTNLRHDFIRTHVMPCEDERLSEISHIFAQLQGEAKRQFQQEGFPLQKVWIERFLDLRYKGQEHTVRTPVSEDSLTDGNLGFVIEKFHELHEQAYSFRLDDPVEIVNFHLVGWGEVEKPELKPLEREGRDMDRAFKGERQVYFEELGMVPSKIYERDLIPPGDPILGPAIIEEPACTTVVCPDQQVVVDERGYLVITEVAR